MMKRMSSLWLQLPSLQIRMTEEDEQPLRPAAKKSDPDDAEDAQPLVPAAKKSDPDDEEDDAALACLRLAERRGDPDDEAERASLCLALSLAERRASSRVQDDGPQSVGAKKLRKRPASADDGPQSSARLDPLDCRAARMGIWRARLAFKEERAELEAERSKAGKQEEVQSDSSDSSKSSMHEQLRSSRSRMTWSSLTWRSSRSRMTWTSLTWRSSRSRMTWSQPDMEKQQIENDQLDDFPLAQNADVDVAVHDRPEALPMHVAESLMHCWSLPDA